VDARHVTLATLTALLREGEIAPEVVKQAVQDLEIDPEKTNPMHA
jgi:pyruvate dehydrogenase E1 component